MECTNALPPTLLAHPLQPVLSQLKVRLSTSIVTQCCNMSTTLFIYCTDLLIIYLFIMCLLAASEKQMTTQKESVSTYETKGEVVEQITKREIIHEEVQSFTEVKASHTQMTMSVGQSVTLKASIPGATDVKWILNGAEIANSESYRYGVSGSDHTLTIKSISQQDQGIITCEARTEHGTVKCQFDTTISEKRSDAPSFLSQPKSQNVNAGQNVTFKCEVSGEPSPEVEWLKDNVLVSGDTAQSLFFHKYTSIHLKLNRLYLYFLSL